MRLGYIYLTAIKKIDLMQKKKRKRLNILVQRTQRKFSKSLWGKKFSIRHRVVRLIQISDAWKSLLNLNCNSGCVSKDWKIFVSRVFRRYRAEWFHILFLSREILLIINITNFSFYILVADPKVDDCMTYFFLVNFYFNFFLFASTPKDWAVSL